MKFLDQTRRGMKTAPATPGATRPNPALHRPSIMRYDEWRTRLGKNIDIDRNPLLSGIAAALREYSTRFDDASLAALQAALAKWRRAWPADTVSSADPTSELYEQVRLTGRMPWGDPVALVNRMAYETRASLLVTFANLAVKPSFLPDVRDLLVGAGSIALVETGFEEKLMEPLTGGKPGGEGAAQDTPPDAVRTPAPHSWGMGMSKSAATDVLDNVMEGGENVFLLNSMHKGYAQQKLQSKAARLMESKPAAAVAVRTEFLAMLKEHIKKIWDWLDVVLTVTWADLKASFKAYFKDEKKMMTDLATWLLDMLLPDIMTYLKPGNNTIRQLRAALLTIQDTLSGEASSWRMKVNTRLHGGLLDSIEQGSYWKALSGLLGGAASATGIALHGVNPLAGKLVRYGWSITKAIVSAILRFRESMHLNALAEQARNYLAQDGYKAGQDLDLDKNDVSFARKDWEFDEWFLKNLRWTPTVGAIAINEKVCDTAAFFWVFDGRGFIRENDYVLADARMRKVENDAARIVKESGLWTAACRADVRVSGKWQVPKALKAAALAGRLEAAQEGSGYSERERVFGF